MTNLTLTTNDNNERVITLKEITDLLSVQHSKAMKTVEELAKEQAFGGVARMSTPTFNPNGSINKYIETYSFTKKQAIIVGARLDNKNLIKLVDKLEELTNRQGQLDSVSDQVQLQRLHQDAKEFEERLHQDAKEFEERLANQKVSNLLNQLKIVQEMGGNFDPTQAITKLTEGTILSEAMSKAVSEVMSEVRYEAPAKSITVTLSGKIQGLPKGVTVQDVMIEMGLMETYTMDVKKGQITKTVIKKKLTSEANYFGYNKPNSSLTKLPVLPLIYLDRADKLIKKINNFIKG